ncbi:hypothetical protein QCD79_14260, partial [Pseudomonas quasicaspiana]|nr:hypothetical protein [Pseudomonas quasicaspiana]
RPVFLTRNSRMGSRDLLDTALSVEKALNSVGVSLLAIALGQTIISLQIYRYREQAHSYRKAFKFIYLSCF